MTKVVSAAQQKKVDFAAVKAQFPALQQNCRGKPLCFFDSGASALKPQCVIDAVSELYQRDYANVHRGVYQLSERATEAYEGVRDRLRDFINAESREELVFTAGTTAAINLVASSFGAAKIREGDEIIVSLMEHHSNLVPWQLLCEKTGAKLRVIPLTEAGSLDMVAYAELFNVKTKLVAIIHVSNVLGTVNPVKQMASIAHQHQVPILVDGAQAIPRLPVDVRDLDCDFYTFSAHKAYGPTGVGVLYGKRELLESMPPYQGGGDMILTVSFDKTIYNCLPYKFEAGTPNIAGVVGFGAALEFLQQIGLDKIQQHELKLTHQLMQAVSEIPETVIYGHAPDKLGMVSFTMNMAHPHDIGTVLDGEGIAVRAGHHCAMPLMEHYHIPGTVRASLGIYNDEADVTRLIQGLQKVYEIFGG